MQILDDPFDGGEVDVLVRTQEGGRGTPLAPFGECRDQEAEAANAEDERASVTAVLGALERGVVQRDQFAQRQHRIGVEGDIAIALARDGLDAAGDGEQLGVGEVEPHLDGLRAGESDGVDAVVDHAHSVGQMAVGGIRASAHDRCGKPGPPTERPRPPSTAARTADRSPTPVTAPARRSPEADPAKHR